MFAIVVGMNDPPIGQPHQRPPTWAEVVGRLHPLCGIFALVEYPTGWWVWLWRSSTGVRTLIEFAGAATIISGVAGLYIERVDRDEDRSTRNAQLIAQIESLAAITEPKNAHSGVRTLMEYLAKEQISMWRISVQGVDLSEADLNGADLEEAKLSGANLDGADLRGAFLSGAILSEAELSGVENLTQAMLDEACIYEGKPPQNLPEGLKPPTNICPEKKP
jgi:hypothetical protein